MLKFPVSTPLRSTDYCHNSSFLYIGLKHSVPATFPFTVKTSLQHLHNCEPADFHVLLAKKVRRLSDVVKRLQNKVVQTIDDVIILSLTPLIISGLFKIYCIIKLHSYLFFFDRINHIKSPNFAFPLISEQRDYSPRSSSTELPKILSRSYCHSSFYSN